jgi:hypothetical protein
MLHAIIQLPNEQAIQDGYIWLMCNNIVEYLQGKQERPTDHCLWLGGDDAVLQTALLDAAAELDTVVNDFPTLDDLPVDRQLFYQHNLRDQAHMLATMYRMGSSLLQAMDEPGKQIEALSLVEKMLTDRQIMAQGSWEHWYRGETKECWERLRQDLQTLGEAPTCNCP